MTVRKNIASSLKPGRAVILPDGRRLRRLKDGSFRIAGDNPSKPKKG